MPYIETGSLSLPFGGRSPRARRTSLQGARVAVRTAQSQASRMLVRYLVHGPQTDGQIALAMGLPEGRISARRGDLIARGLVVYRDDVMGPYGAECGRYELSVKGLHIAATLVEMTR